MSNDEKIYKIEKLDFGVNMKSIESRDPIKKPEVSKKNYLKLFIKFLKNSTAKTLNFNKFFLVWLSKTKKTFSRSIFLGRGYYFKYIANLALLMIILTGAFVYLSFDKNDPKGFLSKYSGIASANSGVFMNTGTRAFVAEKQVKISQYTVKPGDVLSSIAAQFSTPDNVITVDSIMWANGLKSNDVLKPGMVLDIPPVSGVVHTVKKGDTVLSIAKKYKLINDNSSVEEITGATQQITDINLLDVKVTQDSNGVETKVPEIVEGQRIIIPGGIIEEAKPVVRLSRPSAPSSPVYTNPVVSNTGFTWPVAGGRGIITQYYKPYTGHYAIDIADRSAPNLVALGSGRVTFAGRNSDGLCAVTVHIDYDNGFSSVYCHMSAIDPSIAQSLSAGIQPRVVAGQVVGRMGMTGMATGIHVHFMLKYKGSYVNPCGYQPMASRC